VIQWNRRNWKDGGGRKKTGDCKTEDASDVKLSVLFMLSLMSRKRCPVHITKMYGGTLS
jgi:hypothetical protein